MRDHRAGRIRVNEALVDKRLLRILGILDDRPGKELLFRVLDDLDEPLVASESLDELEGAEGGLEVLALGRPGFRDVVASVKQGTTKESKTLGR